MANSFYFNMERLSLEVAREHVNLMTDNNMMHGGDVADELKEFIDNEDFIPNLKKGTVVITMLTCYIESFLNSVLSSCMHYEGKTLMKCSMEEKLEIIFLNDHNSLAGIKSKHEYEVFKKVNGIRNELIHFKKAGINEGIAMRELIVKSENLASFFTKSWMEKCCDSYERLIELIAKGKGLSVYRNVDIISCDGRDGLVSYVFDKEFVNIDESREDLDKIFNYK